MLLHTTVDAEVKNGRAPAIHILQSNTQSFVACTSHPALDCHPPHYNLLPNTQNIASSGSAIIYLGNPLPLDISVTSEFLLILRTLWGMHILRPKCASVPHLFLRTESLKQDLGCDPTLVSKGCLTEHRKLSGLTNRNMILSQL